MDSHPGIIIYAVSHNSIAAQNLFLLPKIERTIDDFNNDMIIKMFTWCIVMLTFCSQDSWAKSEDPLGKNPVLGESKDVVFEDKEGSPALLTNSGMFGSVYIPGLFVTSVFKFFFLIFIISERKLKTRSKTVNCKMIQSLWIDMDGFY